MQTKPLYVVTGIFIICALSSIYLLILWLASGYKVEYESIYRIYMQESVAGMVVDAPVEFNGVIVGSVQDIELNTKNPKLVDVLVAIDKTTPISQGTQASPATRGLTGVRYISLIDQGKNLKPLLKRPNQPYPVIATSPSIALRLDTALSQMNREWGHIRGAFESLLNKDDLELLRETVYNIQQISSTLKTNSTRMDNLLANARAAKARIAPLSAASQEVIKTLDTQTLPAVYHLLAVLEGVMKTLAETGAEVKESPSILLRGKAPGTPGPGE